MTAETFDPNQDAQPPSLSDADVGELLDAASRVEVDEDLGAQTLGLEEHTRQRLGPRVRAAAFDWAGLATSEPPQRIAALIKLLVLAESRFPAWEAGAQSAVVPLARELRSQDRYPAELTVWIRAHSTNRFLPYGSLLDRL
ncbi:MAG: hypothetical protein AAF648_08060 [Pseudomonadota bacterium]